MSDGRSDQKRSGQTRAFGDGNGINFFFLDACARQNVVNQHQRTANMVAAGEFRHNAAVGSVHVDLRVDGVCQQSFFAVDQRNAGFIARAFNAENFHEI